MRMQSLIFLCISLPEPTDRSQNHGDAWPPSRWAHSINFSSLLKKTRYSVIYNWHIFPPEAIRVINVGIEPTRMWLLFSFFLSEWCSNVLCFFCMWAHNGRVKCSIFSNLQLICTRHFSNRRNDNTTSNFSKFKKQEVDVKEIKHYIL